jgi:site-specific recombinase XerD
MDRTPHRPEDSLLLNERSRRLSYPTVNHVFKDLLTQAGIARDPRKGPRLHHLRHTFAVHRLLAWYRDGQDVQARLPALATYMGHVELASTRVYLRPTAELLDQVQRRFHRHFRQHLSLPGDLS